MKNEFKHTPGPWAVSRNGRSVLARSVKINQSSGPGGQGVSCQIRFEEMLRANANLIAAAPELLEIITGLLDSFEAYIALNKPENEWDEYDYMMLPRWKAAHALVERLK